MISFILSLFIPRRDLWKTPTYCELMAKARLHAARQRVAKLERELDRESVVMARNENMRREKRVQFSTNHPSIVK